MTVPPFIAANADALPARAAALIARLTDADPTVRRIAVLDIADHEDADLLPALVDVLRNDDAPEVRSEAARVLASWEEGDVIAALCEALLDADADVREAAAQSLSELKDPASAHVLVGWADRPEPFVRAAVLRGLRELRFASSFALALRALADDAATVRLEAVAVLGWLKDARALSTLAEKATGDADAGVRRAAVGALGFAALEDGFVVAALLDALVDDAWQVREEAATTLGKLRAPIARDALIAALDDAYWQVRVRATRALGQLREAAAVRPVQALLTHTISNLRKEAALALGEIRDRAALAALRDALDDSDPDVRKAARIAIQQIESPSA
ncbi:HEAT repeat domain-containing protein [Trinickia sp. EG282A]|uniref:HEAT repeat domain-containing protein n=1 Tax=Trinickia sp. EG282A TaxID=3237013 RepID=UPI0034D25223